MYMNEENKNGKNIPKICKTCKYGNSPCDWCFFDPDGDLNWEWNGEPYND